MLFLAFLLFKGNVGKLMGIETGAAKTVGQRAKNKQTKTQGCFREEKRSNFTKAEWGQGEGSQENQILVASDKEILKWGYSPPRSN